MPFLLAATFSAFLCATSAQCSWLTLKDVIGGQITQKKGRSIVTKQGLKEVESKCYKDDLKSVAQYLPLVAYPLEAKRRKIAGKVTIKVFVNESGNVYYAEPLDGPRLLRKVTLQSARSARFKPFTQEGKPIKCAGTLTYTFLQPD